MYEMRPCPRCRSEHLLESPEELCFACWRADHPFQGVPGVRIDAAGDDSTDPKRVRDGTAIFNTGLPGVDTVIGTRKDGRPALAYRPLSNREVSSNANRREILKRTEKLVAYEPSVYRSPR